MTTVEEYKNNYPGDMTQTDMRFTLGRYPSTEMLTGAISDANIQGYPGVDAHITRDDAHVTIVYGSPHEDAFSKLATVIQSSTADKSAPFRVETKVIRKKEFGEDPNGDIFTEPTLLYQNQLSKAG